jgi:hypothetical protein
MADRPARRRPVATRALSPAARSHALSLLGAALADDQPVLLAALNCVVDPVLEALESS